MPADHNEIPDPFTERVAQSLRGDERFGDDFEQSLVEAIRADRSLERLTRRRRPFSAAWWSAPSIRVSPLAGLAAAASIAGLVRIVTPPVQSPAPTPIVAAPTVAQSEVVHDTVTYVRFVFVGDARSVALVGDFNAWGATPVQLTSSGSPKAWSASVPLPKGRHEYAFIVDGKQWVADQFAPTSSDEFDAPSSVITIGG